MHRRITGATRVAVALISTSLIVGFLPRAQALELPQEFIKLSQSPVLNHPGILVEDLATGETIFSSAPTTLRAPASVLKLISTTTALKAFGPDKKFMTTISATAKPSVFVLTGESDPWLTTSPFEAKKYHRAYSPYLINKVLAAHPRARSISLYYKDVYALDVANLKRFFRGRVKIVGHVLPGADAAKALITAPIASISSPPMRDIIKFTLLWSDNVLANRLAYSSARQLGLSSGTPGLQGAFEKTLKTLNVPSEGLAVQDGNGLSHATRVSARTIESLLLEIQRDPELKIIYDGLPTAGKTGTLKNRFVTDAPSAVGLVKAKTGWIDNTVSLAGFVTVGAKQYAFTFIADRIANRESARSAARTTIDKMLALIARPRPIDLPAPAASNP